MSKQQKKVDLEESPRRSFEKEQSNSNNNSNSNSKKKKQVQEKEEEEEVDVVSDEDDQKFTPEKGSDSYCATIAGVLCFPFTICGSCFCVKEREEAVILSCGKYSHTVREPGIHFSNCWGREIIPISKAKLSTDIPNTKVIDRDGNPVMVSGVVFYHFRDTKKAAIDILDRQTFVSDQAAATLKQIVSHYPYDNHEAESDEDSDDADKRVPCLKQDTSVIGKALVRELQKRVYIAGAKIDSFRFNEISYAPEIAASLLKKQQASAIVASRHTLVDGAVRIAHAAVTRLEKKGIAVEQADKGRLISNLLTVVCADEHVQPVISLGST